MSLVSANDTGARRLVAMMEEFGLRSIDALADHIIDRSVAATREAIRGLPNGDLVL